MRLIDVDFLKSELIKWRDNDSHRKNRSLIERWIRKEGINVLIRVVDAFPSMPYEPVKHGRWILHDNGSGTCDQCNFTQKHIWDDDGWQNYCGVCGADMRELHSETHGLPPEAKMIYDEVLARIDGKENDHD